MHGMRAHIHTEDEWPAAAEDFVSFSLREGERDKGGPKDATGVTQLFF